MLLGQRAFPAQNTEFVLTQFATRIGVARRAYARFVRAGLGDEAPADWDGGGLRRSAGDWVFVPQLARGREHWRCDERVLGSGEFVDAALARLAAAPVRSQTAPSIVLAALCHRLASRFDVSAREIASPSQRRRVLAARALLCEVAVCHHGFSLSSVARHLGISRPSVARAVIRARAVHAEYGCTPADFLTR